MFNPINAGDMKKNLAAAVSLCSVVPNGVCAYWLDRAELPPVSVALPSLRGRWRVGPNPVASSKQTSSSQQFTCGSEVVGKVKRALYPHSPNADTRKFLGGSSGFSSPLVDQKSYKIISAINMRGAIGDIQKADLGKGQCWTREVCVQRKLFGVGGGKSERTCSRARSKNVHHFLLFCLTRGSFFDNRHGLPKKFDNLRAAENLSAESHNSKC